MENVILALLIVIVILIIYLRNSLTDHIANLEYRIQQLEKYIRENIHQNITPAKPQEVKEKTVDTLPSSQPRTAPPLYKAPTTIERQGEVISDTGKPASPPPFQHKPAATSKSEPALSFFERHPDLEKFIGENLVNKIGIAILVIGIAFFVKLAIDNNWIGPIGRVSVGIICGAALVGLAHYLRNTYRAFSSVLVGGGLAVFYFTITLAYQEFHLFSQPTAFAILIAITVFAVLLSLLYDKEELAVIALIGGFTSPLMASNGHANYNVLFIYLLILNTGLLVIAYFKSWRALNIISFMLTVLMFLSVLFTLNNNADYATGFLFSTLFYLLYFAINVAYNIRENKHFIASDFGILLINTALYFAVGLYFINSMHLEPLRGLFTAALGFINLVLSFILFRNKKADSNVLYLLIGITLTFISLTAPIQLHGHYITLFWAAEAVLLYWLYQKSGILIMRYTSLLVWLAMLISLLTVLFQTYKDPALALTIIANKGFITVMCAAVSSFILFYLKHHEYNDGASNRGVDIHKSVFQIAAVLLLFLSGYLEINHQFLNHFPGTQLNVLYLSLYGSIFIAIFNVLSVKYAAINWLSRLIITTIGIIIYLGYSPVYFDLQYQILKFGKPDQWHFTAHWTAACFVGFLFYQLIQTLLTNLRDYALGAWLVFGGIVLFMSFEFCLLSNWLFYSAAYPVGELETIYVKTFLPVLWGLLSFAMMWLGMRNRYRPFRIISLTLFTLTLIKLFAFDISNIPPAGKIIAFICLGILLLIISFMYQKVKKIITDEKKDDQ